ncbi:hypothetical protein [Desulfogranum mediterraneum]|uniref:hypothetical protein n=1 Tax=Desulfogranum mediterraneum TaxID=160661 RepID=UPI00040FA4EB|nr:hypothetical protein [Desulfogranum mediterraneum]
MSGKPINSVQIKVYTMARSQGKTQKTAAAMAGISERSGRRIEKGEYRHGGDRRRHWRTHPDCFAQVWQLEILPLLEENPELRAITLFRHLQDKFPGQYGDSKLRTFQRRVSRWKSLHPGAKR